MCLPVLSTPFQLPHNPIPLGCPREPALSALLHASNLHWSSILHMVTIYIHFYMSMSTTKLIFLGQEQTLLISQEMLKGSCILGPGSVFQSDGLCSPSEKIGGKSLVYESRFDQESRTTVKITVQRIYRRNQTLHHGGRGQGSKIQGKGVERLQTSPPQALVL